MTKKRLF